VVLARWRAVEHALTGVAHGTPESDGLPAEAIRLRDEYGELILAVRRNDAAEPAPFPLETEPLA
jgi:hypothetical protein